MYSQEMYGYGAKSSVIRELFAYGIKRKAEIGDANVYDFSLGNPSVPPPKEVNEAIEELLKTESPLALHGYTLGPGLVTFRQAIAEDLNERYGTDYTFDQLYITCGAAAALKIILAALYEEGDEALTLAPFFPEYSVFAKTAGYKFRAVASRQDNLQPDLAKLEAAITEKTKLIIINSPNNPSGVVYTKENLEKISLLLSKKEAQYGHPIFLVSDEPYRELVYDGTVPFVPNIYHNAIVCYSFSKSLSIPGERIGYVAIGKQVTEYKNLYLAVCGAGRALGYVCAPSLLQQVVMKCIKCRPDLAPYDENRKILYDGLTKLGYDCIYPDGAFYMFVRALEEDANHFSERAKAHEILLPPGDSFGGPGFVRISYCVSKKQIEDSMPAFAALMREYRG